MRGLFIIAFLIGLVWSEMENTIKNNDDNNNTDSRMMHGPSPLLEYNMYFTQKFINKQ